MNAFEGLKYLQVLHLQGNIISRITSRAFNGLDSLHKLDLSHQRLTFVPRDAFEGMVSLQVLNLNSNNIKTVEGPFVPRGAHLQYLDLRNNPVQDIPQSLLNSLSRVDTLISDSSSLCCLATVVRVCEPKWMFSLPAILSCDLHLLKEFSYIN